MDQRIALLVVPFVGKRWEFELVERALFMGEFARDQIQTVVPIRSVDLITPSETVPVKIAG
jgi:hypothetical protein